jgi:hypothetical protein
MRTKRKIHMNTPFALLFMSVAIAIIVLYVAANSPMGYQDEHGFHYGIDPREKHQ